MPNIVAELLEVADLPEAAYEMLEAFAERIAITTADQADPEANQADQFCGVCGDAPPNGDYHLDPQTKARAISFLAKADPATEGQGGNRGEKQTFRVACDMVRFGITDAETVCRLLWDHWNNRCQPPWDWPGLLHKAEQACSLEKKRDRVENRGSGPPSENGDGRHDGRKVNEAADDPHRLARIFMEKGIGNLVFYRGEFHQWRESAYRPMADYEVAAGQTKAIKAEFNRFNIKEIDEWESRGKTDKKSGEPSTCPVARQVTKRLIANVDQALKGMTVLSGDKEAPLWLTANPPFPAEDVLPARNALVHLPSFVEGKKTSIAKPTPSYFCTYAVDYDFNPTASRPEEWHKFLQSIWGDDEESKQALQEWIGYLLTPDTRLQTIAFLLGPPRSGRGTIARVIRALIGNANVAGPTLSGLATNFGLSTFIGKPVAIVGDARLSKRSDVAVIVERLLNLSGEDAVDIDRKHLPLWTGKLPTRFMILANELPRFPDQAGALVSRYLLFRFLKSFVGKEDRGLDARLRAELPGIQLWAIEGWKRLRERGRFEQPKAGISDLKQARDLNSPVGEWVRERANTEGENLRVRCDDAFGDWKQWCEAKNQHPGVESSFGRNLRSVVPTLDTSDPYRVVGSKSFARDYLGIELKVVF